MHADFVMVNRMTNILYRGINVVFYSIAASSPNPVKR